jgi:methionyl-tRNA formyltransferase
MSQTYRIAIAGTTAHTLMCAKALASDSRFDIAWVLTPSPRLVGRKQELVKNPLHQWAEKLNIPTVFVNKKMNENIKKAIEATNEPAVDFLLVVDFGYIIPDWLLGLPKIAPINIHPSELPKYRGSSPGQFVLLFGEEQSAISLLIMDNLLDHGDLIYQDNFSVLNTWSMSDYYQFAFNRISVQLPNILVDFATGKITPTPQPDDSPTIIAGRLSREDGYLSWDSITQQSPVETSNLLRTAYAKIGNWPQTIANAVRAFSPWPGVWTIIPTTKGNKRMKILEAKNQHGKLELIRVQIEGQQPSSFNAVKNQILTGQ